MTLKITTDNISSTALQTLGGGVKITSLTYPNSATAADPAGSETITVNGSGFSSGAKVYIDTVLCTTTYVSSTSLTFTSPAKSIASYHLFVYNTDGGSAIYPLGMVYSSLPTWVTSAGALTNAPLSSSYSQTVSATGDGTITYSITSGSLPSGLSLNSSTGAITGTVPGTPSSNTFTITATDSQNQKASRSFSIAVIATPTALDYLVVAGGGAGGAWYNAGGGGAGGLLQATGVSITAGVTYTITVGAGGTGSSTNGVVGQVGANSSISGSGFTTVTAIGGGGGSSSSNAATNGGSGGGSSGYITASSGVGVYPGSTYLSQTRQGYDGGFGATYGSGGGGGAGARGTNGQAFAGGNGGIGVQWSDGNYYGGGGGGAAYADSTGNTPGNGGNGGGGRGATYPAGSYTTSTSPATSGSPNTGGGGGGASGYYTSTPGDNRLSGSGGSGVVIIRYADSYGAASSTTGSPIGPVSTGGYKYYTFNGSGTITF
jgi:hypothetical protein